MLFTTSAWTMSKTSTDFSWALFAGHILKKSTSPHKWWLYEAFLSNLKTLDDVLIHLRVTLLVIIIYSYWYYFCVNLPKSSVIIFQTVFFFLCRADLWLSEPPTDTQHAPHHLPYPFDIDPTPAFWRSSALGFIFPFSCPSLNFLCPSKARVRDMH